MEEKLFGLSIDDFNEIITRQTKKLVLAALKKIIRPGVSILDAGSGMQCMFLDLLLENPGVKYIALDMDAINLDSNESCLKDAGFVNYGHIQAHMEYLQEWDRIPKCDIVVCSNVLFDIGNIQYNNRIIDFYPDSIKLLLQQLQQKARQALIIVQADLTSAEFPGDSDLAEVMQSLYKSFPFGCNHAGIAAQKIAEMSSLAKNKGVEYKILTPEPQINEEMLRAMAVLMCREEIHEHEEPINKGAASYVWKGLTYHSLIKIN